MPEPVFDLIPKNQLSTVDTAAIVALCSRAFEEDYAPYLETFEGAVHVFARLDGILVSHALWVTRWLKIGDRPRLRTAYVEGVATAAAYRGWGLATAVMERLVSEIDDYDIAGLSPAETTLYARLGWEFWRGPLFTRKEGNLTHDVDEALMIFRLPKTPSLNLSLPISIEWRQGEVW
jgi:aminoglycoside 2'-N-acetyltransferase I